MSRLDRFLLSPSWCDAWPNCIQLATPRGLSDHVPLVLHVDEDDWGPRPFRILKCWADIPGYELCVKEQWASYNIDGWGAYVLKEKLKRLKGSLKEWHQNHSQNLESRCGLLKERMSILDIKGETTALVEEEEDEIHALSVKLHSLSRI